MTYLFISSTETSYGPTRYDDLCCASRNKAKKPTKTPTLGQTGSFGVVFFTPRNAFKKKGPIVLSVIKQLFTVGTNALH